MGTFLPFRVYNTDNQLIIHPMAVFLICLKRTELEKVFVLLWHWQPLWQPMPKNLYSKVV